MSALKHLIVGTTALTLFSGSPAWAAKYVTDAMFGQPAALCQGADETAQIQRAIDYGIANGEEIIIPGRPFGQACAFSGTLKLNGSSGGINGVTLRGETRWHDASSTLMYTGTGTALQAKNGSGFVYMVSLKDFVLMPGASSNAALAIDLTVQESVFSGVDIVFNVGGSPPRSFTTGWKCTDCSINHWDHLKITGPSSTPAPGTTGMYFTYSGGSYTSSTNFVRSGNFFQLDAGIKVDGFGDFLVIRDNWFEWVNYAILFDDTGGTTQYGGFIQNNRFLMNLGASYASQTLTFKNGPTKQMIINPLHFEGNTVFCAAGVGLCSNDYPIKYQWTGPTANSSLVSLFIAKNSFIGASAGIFSANNGTSSNIVLVRGSDNYSVNQAGTVLPNDFSIGASGVSAKVSNIGGKTIQLNGNGTASVTLIGQYQTCVCSNANPVSGGSFVKCSVDSSANLGVLNITGTASDTIAYFCF